MNHRINARIASTIAFILGLIFIKAGMEKLTGIPDIIGPQYLIKDLAEHNLELFGKFIAYSQVIIGFLLITNRFRTIGAIMLFPMLINILVVTISLEWKGTPFVLCVFLLMNIILLIIDFNKIKFILSDLDYEELKQIRLNRKNIKVDIFYLVPLTLIFIGSGYGWTKIGVQFANSGFLLILLSILALNIYQFLRKKKEKTNFNGS